MGWQEVAKHFGMATKQPGLERGGIKNLTKAGIITTFFPELNLKSLTTTQTPNTTKTPDKTNTQV